jgi:hypothetical protein
MNNPVQKAATDDYTNALQKNAKAIETLSKLE